MAIGQESMKIPANSAVKCDKLEFFHVYTQ